MAYRVISATIDEKLLIKIKDLKVEYDLSWNDLIAHLCNTIPRPEEYQKNYERHYGDKVEFKFGKRIHEKTWISFNTFAVPFVENRDALDYLIYYEKHDKTFRSMNVLDQLKL